MSKYNNIISGFYGLEKSLDWARSEDVSKLANDALTKIVSSYDGTPIILVAQKELSKINNINLRLHVMNQLNDKLLRYYQDRRIEEEELLTLSNELNSYMHYLQILDENALHIQKLYESSLKHNPACDRQRSELFIYYYILDREKYHQEFLNFSQAHYHYAHEDTSVTQTSDTLPVYTNLYKKSILVSSSIELCKSLMDAEYFRQRSLYGEKAVPTTVKSFPVALRNHCFDKYIEVFSEKERQSLLTNNDRDEEPSLDDAKIELLKKEVAIYKSAGEQDIDPEVLKMANYFIRYLRRDLGWDNPEEERIDPSSEELNIPNENNDIDRRIRAVSKTKGLIRFKADWGAIFKIHVEEGLCKNTDYAAFAARVNFACTGGKREITTADAIRQSPALYIIRGKWTSEGWRDRLKSRKSAGLLLRYVKIAQAYTK